MCLAVPAKIIELDQSRAKVEVGGITREASTALLPEAAVGDYVLVHAGFAITLVDEEEAQGTLRIFDEMAAAQAHGGFAPGADDSLEGRQPGTEGTDPASLDDETTRDND